MTKCNSFPELFQAQNSRKLKASFGEQDITSDGGAILLKGMDQKLKITNRVSEIMQKYDARDSSRVTHDMESMTAQRIFAISCGYEDLNDHLSLSDDVLFQSIAGRDSKLAGPSTLCRNEQAVQREACVELSKLLVELFIESFKETPEELVLDFDATDSIIHGKQELCYFHGYYKNYCYLPLYVFCEEKILVSYLRPSKIDGARHAQAILSFLVGRLRREWPDVRIIFRGDSGFCRHRMFNWCERNKVKYITGIGANDTLKARGKNLSEQAREQHARTGESQKLFEEFTYGAKTWSRERRIIHKSEHNGIGDNDRYVVTNITEGGAKYLYEKVYCARGDMENRIKEQQLYLFADRTSSHAFITNQFRLLLSAYAYVLMESLRSLALQGTEFAKAQCNTIRLKLIKIGAVVRRNTRSLYISLSSSYPHVETFTKIVNRIVMLA